MVRCTLEEFGGKPEEGHDNTYVFSAAFSSLAANGGGTLSVAPGRWETGPITLPSGCTLDIQAGATVSFIADFERYKPVWTRWEGVECFAMQPCIQARNASRVSIVGSGTVDGGGKPWWDYRNLVRSDAQRGPVSSIERQLAQLNPDYALQPGGGGGRRSQFLAPPAIQLYRCTDVSIRGITVVDSPFWTIHPVYCERVVIEGVTVKNPHDAPNTDGLDIDSCKEVVVVDCHFDVGDDAIALKSGSGADGIRVGIPTSDVTIKGCTVKRAHGGIVIGSETAAGIHTVVGSHCTFIDTDRGIRIKTRRGRGGNIEHLHFSDIRMERTLCPIAINMYYRCGVLPDEMHRSFSLDSMERDGATPSIRSVVIQHLSATGSKASAGFFVGLPESPVTDLTLIDCHIDTRSEETVSPEESEMYEGLPPPAGRGMRFRHCQSVHLQQVVVEGPEEPFVVEEGVAFL